MGYWTSICLTTINERETVIFKHQTWKSVNAVNISWRFLTFQSRWKFFKDYILNWICLLWKIRIQYWIYYLACRVLYKYYIELQKLNLILENVASGREYYLKVCQWIKRLWSKMRCIGFVKWFGVLLLLDSLVYKGMSVKYFKSKDLVWKSGSVLLSIYLNFSRRVRHLHKIKRHESAIWTKF